MQLFSVRKPIRNQKETICINNISQNVSIFKKSWSKGLLRAVTRALWAKWANIPKIIIPKLDSAWGTAPRVCCWANSAAEMFSQLKNILYSLLRSLFFFFLLIYWNQPLMHFACVHVFACVLPVTHERIKPMLPPITGYVSFHLQSQFIEESEWEWLKDSHFLCFGVFVQH